MADYSKKQDKSTGIFAQSMQTFTQRAEDVFSSLNETIMSTTTTLNATLQDLVKSMTLKAPTVAKASKTTTGVTDTLELIAAGMADIVSFLYEKQYNVQQLGTAGTTIDAFLAEKKGADTGPGSGESAEAKVLDSSSAAIKNLLELFETFNIANYVTDMAALKSLFIEWNEAMKNVKMEPKVLDDLKEMSKASGLVITAFNNLTKNPNEQRIKAIAGRCTLIEVAHFFDKFAEVFNIDRLTEVSANASRINASQISKLAEFWVALEKILNIAGNPKIVVQSRAAQQSINKLEPVVKKLTTDFMPTVIEFNDKAQDITKSSDAIHNVARIFIDFAALGKSSVVIVVTAPFIGGAIKATKKMMNKVGDLSKTVNDKADVVKQSKKNIAPFKDVIMGIIGIALSIVAIGLVASYVKNIQQGVYIIIVSVLCMIGIVAVMALLQAAIGGIGGSKQLLKPIGSVKSLIVAILATVGSLILLGALAPVVKPLIMKGLDVIKEVFMETIFMGIIIGVVLLALGGKRTVTAPLKSIIGIVLAALITIVAIIFLSKFVKTKISELTDGIILVTGSLLLVAFSFRIAAMGIMGANPRTAKRAVKMITRLMLFSVLNIILMIVVAKKLTPQEIVKSLIVPISMILIAITFKMMGKHIRGVATKRMRKAIWTLMALTVVSAAVIFFMGKYIKPEHLVGIAIYFGALIGIVYMYKFIYKQLFGVNWHFLTSNMNKILKVTLLGAAAMWLAGFIGSKIDILGLVIVAAAIVGFAFVLKLLNKLNKNFAIQNGAEVLFDMGIAIGINAIALGILGYVTNLYENVSLSALLTMAGVIIGFGAIMYVLGTKPIYNSARKGVEILGELGIAIGINAGALALLGATAMLYEYVEVSAMFKMAAVVIGFGAIAAVLGMSPIVSFARRGVKILDDLGMAILMNTAGLAALALVSFLYEFVKPKNMAIMSAVVIGFGLMAAGLGVPPIVASARRGVKILEELGMAILMNTAGLAAFALVSFLYEFVKPKNMAIMASVVLAFGGMVALLGIPPISAAASAGCAVLGMLALSIIEVSAGLALLALTSLVFTPKVKKSVANLKDVVLIVADILWEIGKKAFKLVAGVAAAALVTAAVIPLSLSLLAIAGVSLLMTPNVIKGTKKIGPVLTSFLHCIDDLSIVDILKVMAKGAAVAAAVIPLAIAIAVVAAAIAAVASLKIPIYEGTEITGYRELQESDFTNAGKNVTKIVTTLGKTMIDLYYGRINGITPEMAEKMFHKTAFFGDTPFALVCESVAKLGKMIKDIAEGVAAYASLRIPLYEGTEVSGYRELDDKDFDSAAKNISKIVTVLGSTLIAMYTQHPEMFSKGIFQSDTPFALVSDSVSKMGTMISKIAKSVQQFAAGVYAKFENGQFVGLFNLGDAEYSAASINISKVITIIGNTLIDLYNTNPDLFKKDDDEGSIFSQMIGSITKMGNMINMIASSVQKVANATFLKYDENGNLIGTFNVGPEQYQAVGDNINKMFSSLIPPLLMVKMMYPLIFNDTKFMDNMDKSMKSLTNMLSSSAGTLVGIASLSIPIYKNGKQVGVRPVNPGDFLMASMNAKLILTTLLRTMMDLYTNSETSGLFKQVVDKDGEVIADSVLGRVINAIMPVSKFLSELAKGVVDFAKARYPRYNKKGDIIGYDQITPADYMMMGLNIRILITSILKTLKDLWDDPALSVLFADDETNILKQIVDRINPVIDFIVKIADAVLKIASGAYEQEGKDGKTIKVRLTSDDYIKAAINTSTVITLLVDTLMGLANDSRYQKVWENEDDSPINKVIKVVKQLNEVIGSVVDAIIKLASGQYSYMTEKGKEIKVNITNLDMQKFADTLKDMILKPIGAMVDICATGEFSRFINESITDDIKKASGDFGNVLSSMKSMADTLGKNNDMKFSMSPIDAYNKFIKEFKVEALDKDMASRIDSAKGLVTSVNTLDIEKANTFANLLRELNMLSARLGDLDKFTKTLSEILAVQLERLTNQLSEAMTAMGLADKIRLEREDSISRILTEINDMLDKPINVQPVMPETEEETDNGDKTTPTPTTTEDPNKPEEKTKEGRGGGDVSDVVYSTDYSSNNDRNKTVQFSQVFKQLGMLSAMAKKISDGSPYNGTNDQVS